ncbi:MAG: hypothetical protein WCH85_08440 [Methanomicrobiales archaeon]
MNKDTDEALDDANALLNMIGGIKKKDEPDQKKGPVLSPVSLPDEKNRSNAGDFSALLKKLGMAKKELRNGPIPPSETSVIPNLPGSLPSDDKSIPFLDNLFEELPQPRNDDITPAPGPEKTGIAENDIHASLGKLLNKIPEIPETSNQASESPPSPSQKVAEPDVNDFLPREIDDVGHKPLENTPVNQAVHSGPTPLEDEPIIEIFEEDPKAALRKNPAKKGLPTVPVVTEKVTESEEKIISVDQITDFSGLILPKGATFKIEELRLHGRINAFESTGTGTLPQELNEIWKREFSSAGFKDLDIDGEIVFSPIRF